MVQYKIESHEAIEKRGEKRGINDVKDYRFGLLINSENYSITIGVAEGFLPVEVSNKDQYKDFCKKVLRQTMEQLTYNKIKDCWKQSKECVALVHGGKITYKPSWKEQGWCEVALNI